MAFPVDAFIVKVQDFHRSHCELLTGSHGHHRLQLTDTQQAPFVSHSPCPLKPLHLWADQNYISYSLMSLLSQAGDDF